ncbi:MAG: 50S ribosomal protein L9 [Defluviitaleaceae bacterium]|nr:50S ribosomal protein L9 [Defluviitaleaceae bacterium]
MKVIMLQDVKGVGKKGQVLEAADGHARNYLIPKKLAKEASKANLDEIENRKKIEISREQRELEQARQLAEKLQSQKVVIPMKMGEKGRLFGAATNREIAEALSAKTGMEIDKKKVVLPEPIKVMGEHKVELKLHAKVTVTISVEIVSASAHK